MLTAPQFSPAALQSVRARIVRAAESADRDPDSVRLLAVSKQQPAALVRAAVAAGQTEFGENYVQEGIDKIAALAGTSGLSWHFIGQLQGNKTREVAERFDWVHTLDRERVASRLSAQRPHHGAPLQVLCLLYTSDAADERSSVDLGGRRIIKKKKDGHTAGAGGHQTKHERRTNDMRSITRRQG